MTDEIKPLKTKLGSVKQRLTKFVKFVSNVENQTKILELKNRVKIIEPTLQEFEDLAVKIQVLDETQAQDLETDFFEFENKYFKALSEAEAIISVNTGPSNQNLTANANRPPQIKLPDIKLPIFTGVFTEWITFRDSYKSLIHNNESLNAIQRFHYLRSSLKGEALETIDHLTPSIDNYAASWQLLEKRYENTRLIAQHHIRAIFSIPTVHYKDVKPLRQILHTVTSNLKSLEAINRPVDQWDDLLIHLITSKFDNNTTIAWEATLNTQMPNMNQIIDFLTQRCQMFEALEVTNHSKTQFSITHSSNHQKQKSSNFYQSSTHISANNNPIKCIICKQNHHIYQCQKFLSFSVDQRLNEIKQLKLCQNCLRNNHTTENCRSSNCKSCNKKHNSLLHVDNHPQTSQTLTTITVSNHSAQIYQKNVILSTALIKVFDANGKSHILRALLDNGSQNHFITNNACQKLGLHIEKIQIAVTGIGNSQTSINRATSVHIQSNYNSFNSTLNCLVVPEISLNHPLITFNSKPLNIPKNVSLADPDFNISRPVDVLIGNEIFYHLIRLRQIKPKGPSGPILQETHLGYIVAASISIQNNQPTVCNLSQLSNLENQVKRFWEINDNDHTFQNSVLSEDDKFCETHFQSNISRDNSGHFVVKYPFKHDPPQLGSSRSIALKRFYSLERKFQRNPQLQHDYNEFMTEYAQLGHMELVPPAEIDKLDPCLSFHLPHHGVIKNDSLTTKLRVVFNGSAKTENNKSLNDNLHVGPSLQRELFCILLQFRTYRYVILADIAKMYRQIIVHPDHRNYQLILWRENIDQPVNTYRLTTVTYGITPSAYLAIRCLHELAKTESKTNPNIATIIRNNFYVDDLLTGANTIEEATVLRDQLTDTLAKGGFQLRKFASNSLELLPIKQQSEATHICLDMQKSTKTLGILWNPQLDVIEYSVSLESKSNQITKRNVLSLISKLFDPLGLVTPITISAKIILQKIWTLQLDWDEQVPEHISNMWSNFITDFTNLSLLSIPRNTLPLEQPVKIELHGFSDASQMSYGASIYIRTISNQGKCVAHLLCSKNRVAPLKTATIPRLELCAALLLTQLVNKIKQTLDLPTCKYFYWTDSMIVLSWLKLEPSNLKTFVAHRVAEIQSNSSVIDWNYIHTSNNPADILSRGTTTSELIKSKLWWHGPDFLNDSTVNFDNIKKAHPTADELPELKPTCCLILTANSENNFELLHTFSSFTRLVPVTVTAYCLRFIHNIRSKLKNLDKNLSCDEIKRAETVVIKLTQRETFSDEIHALSKHKNINQTSTLRSLHPFLDKNGILRVGGRLRNANISYNNKHQIILPKNHSVTKLIATKEHLSNLHAGYQMTLSAIRNKYWPIAATNTVRKIVKSCITCRKVKPVPYEQLMGDLPENRVKPSKPFTCAGVDYAGPFNLKNSFNRSNKTIKAFIVIFVCFSTRAVHIELVCDCTAATFLNALKRFIARRGRILHLYSDNGTNFVGANRELSELKALFDSQEFNNEIINYLTNEEVNWHFIPPRSPHMGGLWESAVRSAKYHLKRVIGESVLNYDEMYTWLAMIEACLNSRPLLPLSSDPLDLEPLTPGHFLIGESLRAPPEPDVTHIATNRLSRYQLVEQLKQSFWKRWSCEYLHQLQQRHKWTKVNIDDQPEIGVLVVLKEDNAPPLHWPMGRIVEVHPGSDGRIRVVSVRTVRGIVKRATNKVCPILSDLN